MVGGLYFGPPGWAPERLLDARLEGDSESERTPADLREVPSDREGFTKLLEQIGLARTSGVTPGLLEQMQEIGKRDIRAIVLNLLPTQPEFAIGAGLTRIGMRQIVDGLLAIQKVIQPRRVIVLLDRHDWRTWRLWRKARREQNRINRANRRAAKTNGNRMRTFETAAVLNQYPLAHPTILMRRLFGKRLPVGRLPVRVNRVLVDPMACWALGRWMRTGQRLTERPVQLFTRGERDGAAKLVMATVGETIASVCDRHGVSTAGMQVIVNGMLAGEEIDPPMARVETSTESISVRELPLPEYPTPCFSCGWCVDVCPTALNPVSLLKLADEAQRGSGAEGPVGAAELRSGEARESLHCIGCGLCSYVCPTRLPLTQRTLRLRGWVLGATAALGGTPPDRPGVQGDAGGTS
jgi:Na+-translocating ferredoxin:NAD+ oxidoreductase RnfC subunit